MTTKPALQSFSEENYTLKMKMNCHERKGIITLNSRQVMRE
jgi:hypothetical protein